MPSAIHSSLYSPNYRHVDARRSQRQRRRRPSTHAHRRGAAIVLAEIRRGRVEPVRDVPRRDRSLRDEAQFARARGGGAPRRVVERDCVEMRLLRVMSG